MHLFIVLIFVISDQCFLGLPPGMHMATMPGSADMFGRGSFSYNDSFLFLGVDFQDFIIWALLKISTNYSVILL